MPLLKQCTIPSTALGPQLPPPNSFLGFQRNAPFLSGHIYEINKHTLVHFWLSSCYEIMHITQIFSYHTYTLEQKRLLLYYNYTLLISIFSFLACGQVIGSRPWN